MDENNGESVARHEREVAFIGRLDLSARVDYWDNFHRSEASKFLAEPHEIGRLGTITELIAYYRQGAKVLDAGCGIGTLSGLLRGIASEYVGVDISDSATHRAKQLHPWAEFVCASIEAYCTLDVTYDVVVCSEILYYCDFMSLMKKFKAILNTHGIVIISIYESPTGKLVIQELQGGFKVLQHIETISHDAGLRWHVLVVDPHYHLSVG